VKRVIHWFRRDLRISDNTALSEAVRRSEQVIPVFIVEDAFRTGPDVGAARLTFLLQSLASLRKNLLELGYHLIVRHGKSEEVLPQLCKEVRTEAVFANKRYEPYAQARDNRVFNALNAMRVGFELFKDAVVWEEAEILTQAEKPFTVFTPYSRVWKAKAISAPRPRLKTSNIQLRKANIQCDRLPETSDELGHSMKQSATPAGERAGLERLKQFMSGPVYEYAANRNNPALNGTSQLSPHLRCGTIGLRTVLLALKKAREKAKPAQRASCDVFLNELIWREFYLQVLHNFPHVMKGGFRPEFDALNWSDNQEHFEAWCGGTTGYPIVDAAMRCLNATGNMQNRLRMIVAMFLTKDLLINWQWGERYFMKQLVDGDMAANNGGWQWSAGTGTDAAPYFRIFNPSTQGEKFDPDGDFVRRWVPELGKVPHETIHQPWTDTSLFGRTGYPERVVIHEMQRQKCLAMFQAVKRPTRKGD